MTHTESREWDIEPQESYEPEPDHTEEVEDLRSLLGNQIFGATFEKRDGTMRTGAFRLKVSKDITGTGSSYDRFARGNMTVWDMEKGAYRTIRIEALQELRCHGTTINFEGE